jgi:peptidoglycan hydrolase-like protein with peptidoglycan-binding domain
MHKTFITLLAITLCVAAVLATIPAMADELTQRIQQDLVTLGYDPGSVDGELTTNTIIAISQFQAERDMPVTGEVSPVLAGILAAEITKQSGGGATVQQASVAPPPAPVQDPAALKAAQEACLQKKIQEAQEAQKKKRGFGRLLSAVTRTASRTGNYDLVQTTNDVYSANATADDLAAAAKDLGLTEDEVAACQNPQ